MTIFTEFRIADTETHLGIQGSRNSQNCFQKRNKVGNSHVPVLNLVQSYSDPDIIALAYGYTYRLTG